MLGASSNIAQSLASRKSYLFISGPNLYENLAIYKIRSLLFAPNLVIFTAIRPNINLLAHM